MTRHNQRHHAFTLTEILVVIGIIVILMVILLPMISNSRQRANKARMMLDIQALVTALEQYKSDLHDYPQVVTAGQGSQTLADALLGPAINNRSGFRIRTGGRMYGPYIQADKFKIADGTTTYVDHFGKTVPVGCLLDMNGNPILYYSAALSKPDITQGTGYVENQSSYANRNSYLYNYADNDDATEPRFTDKKMMRAMLGDYNNNGRIDGGETAKYTGPYILWSAGPDGLFGPINGSGAQLAASATPNTDSVNASDDVMNFQR